MHRRALLGLLLVTGAFPLAAADDGPLAGAPETSVGASPFALLVGDLHHPMRVTAFTLRAERLRVHEYAQDTLMVRDVGGVGGLGQPGANGSREVQDAVVTFVAEGEGGFLGVHPGQGAAVRLGAAGPLRLARHNHSVIQYAWTSEQQSRDRNAWESVTFFRTVSGEHLYMSAPGEMAFQGPAAVQIMGPRLRIEGRGGAEEVQTGRADSPQGPQVASRETRWVVLEADNLTLDATAATPWQVASGEVWTDASVISPTGLRPRADALAAPAASSSGAAAPAASWGLFGVVVGVALAGGVASIAWRARRSPVRDPVESWDPEECLRRACVHVEAERWGRALEWATRARELAPTSARVASTQAFILERTGRLADALAAYEAAARLSPGDGEHELEAARVAVEAGRPLDEAETLLARALAKSPRIAPEVEERRAFLALADRPAFRRAMDDAWAAFARELSGDAGEDA